MAIGDDAALAGMALVPGSLPADEIDTELTRTRDYIANGPSLWKPGVSCSIAKGGTGATTASGARTALGLAAMDAGISADTLVQRDNNKSIAADFAYIGQSPVLPQHATPKSYVDAAVAAAVGSVDLSSRVAKSGDTMSGNLFLPASSAATSSYTIAYINGDGRVSRGASTERVKKFITDIDPLSLGALFPVFKRWQMRNGDGVWRYGYTAEQLTADPVTEPFVVYERHVEDDGTAPNLERDEDGNPIPISIDFIGLLLAQVAQLNARVTELESRG